MTALVGEHDLLRLAQRLVGLPSFRWMRGMSFPTCAPRFVAGSLRGSGSSSWVGYETEERLGRDDMALWTGMSMEEVFSQMSPEDRRVMGEGTPEEAAVLLRKRSEEADRPSHIAAHKRYLEGEERRLAKPHKIDASVTSKGYVSLHCERCDGRPGADCPAAKEWLADRSVQP